MEGVGTLPGDPKPKEKTPVKGLRVLIDRPGRFWCNWGTIFRAGARLLRKRVNGTRVELSRERGRSLKCRQGGNHLLKSYRS